MTEIERKALALMNATSREPHYEDWAQVPQGCVSKSLIRALEQHEAFRQEVSDAVVNLNRYWEHCEPAKEDFYARFDRFIIPKPVDPLVEALAEAYNNDSDELDAANVRAAIEKRGGRIVFDGSGA